MMSHQTSVSFKQTVVNPRQVGPWTRKAWHIVRPLGIHALVQIHQNCVLRLQLSIKDAFHVTVGTWQHITWNFFTIQSAGWEFPHQPFYLPHQPFGKPMPHLCFALFLVAVRYGRATCQNHVIYEAITTVSLWGLASHSYLFRGVLHFFRCSIVYTYCMVTCGESGPRSAPCDPTTVPL